MSRRPAGRAVQCPNCESREIAIVPKQSELVGSERAADGKVWTVCRSCEERFVVHYRIAE